MNKAPESRLAKFARLNNSERRWLLSSFMFLPVAGLALRLLGYRQAKALIERWTLPSHAERPTVGGPAGETAAVALGIARMVSIAARHGPYRANCLPQALVGWCMLQRRGIPAELKIGVNKDPASFAAHAWLESGNMVLLGGTDAPRRYLSFPV